MRMVAKEPIEYCFLWINWWATCLTKAEWAGWAQALGTIAAVGVAVWLSSREHARSREEQERRSKEERRQTLETLGRLLFGIFWCLKKLDHGYMGDYGNFVLQRILREQIATLDKVDPFLLDLSEVATSVFTIRAFSRTFLATVEAGAVNTNPVSWVEACRGQMMWVRSPTEQAIKAIRINLADGNEPVTEWSFGNGAARLTTADMGIGWTA